MPSPFIPVQVGDLRRHPKGHTLRVRRILYSIWAECVPDPPVRGRRTTNIMTDTVGGFPLVVEPEPEPKPEPEPSP
jgi:hypothetical protein